MNRLTGLAFAAALVVVSGCASVPMAPAEQDLAAKEFRPADPGRANVYLYRNEVLGAAVRMDVLVDGVAVGQTAAKTFFLLPVGPGQHTFVSKSENTSELPLAVEGGRNYFVWQEVKMGVLYARTKLQLVDEATGKAGVMECRLAQTLPPGGTPPAPPPPAAPGVPSS